MISGGKHEANLKINLMFYFTGNKALIDIIPEKFKDVKGSLGYLWFVTKMFL